MLGTERLRLRPLRDEDADAVVRGCSDALTQYWLPRLPQPYGLHDAREYITGSEALRLSGAGIRCAVALRESDDLVASILLKRTDWRDLVTEVGYWGVPEHRGRGYVQEAARALALWAFGQGMERVELLAAPDNVASNRVAVRAGFTLEGMKRSACEAHPGRVDLNLYSLIRADVEPERAQSSVSVSGSTSGSSD